MGLVNRLLPANPGIQVSTLLSGSLSTPGAKGVFTEGHVLISSQRLGADSAYVEFTSIAARYAVLEIYTSAKQTSSNGQAMMTFNSDTGANYQWTQVYASNSGSKSYAGDNGVTAMYGSQLVGSSYSLTPGGGIARIVDPSSSLKYKTFTSLNSNVNGTASDHYVIKYMGQWRNTAAITTIRLTSSTGNFASGSLFELYGVVA